MKYTHTQSDIPQENEYPKLVRDKIPQIIKENSEIDADIRYANNSDEYLSYLQQKVVEEANELKDAKTKEHILEEIVDVLEVIDTICKIENFSKKIVEQVQSEKRLKRGGFEGGIIMNKRV